MRRIRIVFLLLAVALLVPMALLVKRALDSVALERRVSHRAVAERLFDEMERELSRVLRIEEERPVGDDRFRQPVAASDDLAVGYFEIEADGTLRPSRSKKGEAARRFAGLVRQGLQSLAKDDREGTEARVEPSAGSTRQLEFERPQEERDVVAATVADADLARKQVSPYDALQSLNKGAKMRSARQVKRAVRESVAPPPVRSRPTSPAPAAESDGFAGARRTASPPSDLRAGSTALDLVGADEPLAAKNAAEAARVFADEADPAAIEVHPMTGRLIDREHLLLSRWVRVDDRSYQQGLVVRVSELFARLEALAAGVGELGAFVEPRFFVDDAEPPALRRTGAYHYRHRFAEPFDALSVQLALDPLPGVAGAGSIYALASLLLISVTIGLLAAYRTVAVTVSFAERRSNFVAAVTHELKTPLTAIRMYSEMLRDGMVADEDKRRSYYSTITAESERLSRLIDNVLEFSRLEQGTRETHLIVGAIGPVVQAAAAMLEPHAREVGFRIDVEVEAGLPPVRFDRDAVVQVVVNLVDNALKYARDTGDRVIVIRCSREGDRLSLAVRDRGPGVSARHVGKIFEAFYRGEDELTRTAKGTGIGLALVKGLADTMGAAVLGRNIAEGGFEVVIRFEIAEPA